MKELGIGVIPNSGFVRGILKFYHYYHSSNVLNLNFFLSVNLSSNFEKLGAVMKELGEIYPISQ